jgi:hypothetical protein
MLTRQPKIAGIFVPEKPGMRDLAPPRLYWVGGKEEDVGCGHWWYTFEVVEDVLVE